MQSESFFSLWKKQKSKNFELIFDNLVRLSAVEKFLEIEHFSENELNFWKDFIKGLIGWLFNSPTFFMLSSAEEIYSFKKLIWDSRLCSDEILEIARKRNKLKKFRHFQQKINRHIPGLPRDFRYNVNLFGQHEWRTFS